MHHLVTAKRQSPLCLSLCVLLQHPGREQGSRGVVIDGVFGLLLTERVVCQACGLETHKVPAHYEHLIVVNSASLNLAAMTMPDASMDHLLAFLFAQETKFCDKDVGGCGEPNVSRQVYGRTCTCICSTFSTCVRDVCHSHSGWLVGISAVGQVPLPQGHCLLACRVGQRVSVVLSMCQYCQ